MLIFKADPAKGKPQGFSTSPSFPLILLWLLFALLLGWPTLGWSIEGRSESAAAAFLQKPADFDDCAKLALRQSPFFIKSSLEIEVRRFDEADSKSDFIPSLFFSSRYYPSQPNNPNVSDPLTYSIAFTTGDYNPIIAYLSLKARKVVTQIAILGHLKVIAEGLKRLGKAFLELNAAERLAQLQGTLAELAQENLRYAQERQKLGQLTPMEIQIASQEKVVAQAEREAVVASQGQIREAIRHFLDLKPQPSLRLELRQARRQVLGDFDPAKASLEKAQSHDFETRIKKLAQELQAWNVTLAKMKFLPKFNLALQTPDPVSSTINRGTFFSIGLNFPIFEGLKRTRNVTRQKTILKQFASEEDVKSIELTQKWREVEEKLRTAATTLRVAEAQAELARLKERQGETLYRSGEKDFSWFMAGRQSRVKAEKEMVKAALEYDLAVLDLRHLSGDLVYNYVQESQFRE